MESDSSRYYDVWGYVWDNNTKPISGAEVFYSDEKIHVDTQTDAKGHFIIKRDEYAKWGSLMVDAPGFVGISVPKNQRLASSNLKIYLCKDNPLADSISGTGSISGKVTDVRKEPIPGTSVHLVNSSFGAVAGFDGEYEFLNIPVGRYTISASTIGYLNNIFKSIIVSSKSELSVDFALDPAPIGIISIPSWGFPLPVISRYMTINEWKLTDSRIRARPAKEVAGHLKVCPGLNR